MDILLEPAADEWRVPPLNLVYFRVISVNSAVVERRPFQNTIGRGCPGAPVIVKG